MKKLWMLMALAVLLCAAALAEPAASPAADATVAAEATPMPEGRELSVYYGQDIARAAEELGGMSFWAGDEYAENYESDALCLRGNGGLVGDIELKDAPGEDALCGVKVGMARADVEALMEGSPMLWEYDEELAFTMREDGENELKNELLVVFFDEEGRVNGAWYRASGIE